MFILAQRDNISEFHWREGPQKAAEVAQSRVRSELQRAPQVQARHLQMTGSKQPIIHRNSMSTFKVGQRVVCVNVTPGMSWMFNPLRNGGVYTVAGVKTCACGQQTLDIDICSYAGGSSCHCGRDTIDGVWWFATHRFRPLAPSKVHQELIEQFNRSHVPETPELIPQTA